MNMALLTELGRFQQSTMRVRSSRDKRTVLSLLQLTPQ
jgi:hypothetical protein